MLYLKIISYLHYHHFDKISPLLSSCEEYNIENIWTDSCFPLSIGCHFPNHRPDSHCRVPCGADCDGTDSSPRRNRLRPPGPHLSGPPWRTCCQAHWHVYRPVVWGGSQVSFKVFF